MRYVWALCLGLAALLAAGESGAWFSDEAASANLNFVHFNGMSGELYYPEMVGAGAALLDYDDDGDLDVLTLQGGMLGPGKTLVQALFRPEPKLSLPLSARLYRNNLSGDGELRFTDVTAGSGLQANDYGMAVAVGDIDNDGNSDIYLANFGANRLYRNNGDGKFTDITRQSGTNDDLSFSETGLPSERTAPHSTTFTQLTNRFHGFQRIEGRTHSGAETSVSTAHAIERGWAVQAARRS